MAAQEMTQAQLNRLVADSVTAALSGKDLAAEIAKALDPLTKAGSARAPWGMGKALDEGTVYLPEPSGSREYRGHGGGRKDMTPRETVSNGPLGPYPFGRIARCIGMGVVDGKDEFDAGWMEKQVQKHWAPTVASNTLQVVKGLSAGNATAAGAMVAPDMEEEWLPLLRNNTVIRRIARTLPMSNGATFYRRQTGAATASYQGELGPTTPSNLTVSTVTLSYKKLRALTVESNDLIRFTQGDSDRVVQEDLLRSAGNREDRAFLVGNPPIDRGSPQGIRYQMAASNVNANSGTALANYQADLARLVRLVEESDVPVDSETGYFILSPAQFWTIYNLTSGTGDMVYARGLELPEPRLLGFRVLKSTALKVSNAWIGANQGAIYFVHAPSLRIHDAFSTEIEAFRGGSYRDENGTVQSGISNDETVITATGGHDFVLAHETAAAVSTGYAS
jgi:HK97 family phage major capsid protein